MSLPDLPPTFKPTAPPITDWWWQLLDADGQVVAAPREERFSNRGDAESWLGEEWRRLAEAGATSAQLFERESAVGPRIELHD